MVGSPFDRIYCMENETTLTSGVDGWVPIGPGLVIRRTDRLGFIKICSGREIPGSWILLPPDVGVAQISLPEVKSNRWRYT